MQPNLKTKSTDFLPQKPSMDGLNKPAPRAAVENNAEVVEDTSDKEQKFVPPKQSAHVIDLKSNSSSENAAQNMPTKIDMVNSRPESLSDTTNSQPNNLSSNSSNIDNQAVDSKETHSKDSAKKNSKIKWLLIIVLIVVLLIVAVIGGVYFASQSSSSNTTTSHNNMNM